MIQCVRVIGAYTFRLSRRHSTVLLIATFIVALMIIFQMYVYRHQDGPHRYPRIGDFDYRPGTFLLGREPNENVSYCEFNYGLPYNLDKNTPFYPTPEVGPTSSYRVIYNAIRGTTYANFSKFNAVTYATQATPEFIYHIVEIARFWDGPISLSVYVPGYDIDITMQIMKQLCHCYSGMSKVSVHLFFPKRFPPMIIPRDLSGVTEKPTMKSNLTIVQILQKKAEIYNNLTIKTRAEYIKRVRQDKVLRLMVRMQPKKVVVPIIRFEDCSGPETYEFPTFRTENSMMYPINVGRNVARNASRTNYFLVSDIELIPSEGLAPKFLTMVRSLMGDRKREEGCIFAKTVFVVPLFEVERGEAIPRDKAALVNLVADNRALYFHQKICPHCQRFPGIQSWLKRPSPKGVEPMVIGRREYPYHRWEPLYFGTQKEPWYSELLSWEGKQDKMTQMVNLCYREYKVVILDGGFLCHGGAAVTVNVKLRVRWKALSANRLKYANMIWSAYLRKLSKTQEYKNASLKSTKSTERTFLNCRYVLV